MAVLQDTVHSCRTYTRCVAHGQMVMPAGVDWRRGATSCQGLFAKNSHEPRIPKDRNDMGGETLKQIVKLLATNDSTHKMSKRSVCRR
eukprot:1138924-Rhodomonas_salina.1